MATEASPLRSLRNCNSSVFSPRKMAPFGDEALSGAIVSSPGLTSPTRKTSARRRRSVQPRTEPVQLARDPEIGDKENQSSVVEVTPSCATPALPHTGGIGRSLGGSRVVLSHLISPDSTASPIDKVLHEQWEATSPSEEQATSCKSPQADAEEGGPWEGELSMVLAENVPEPLSSATTTAQDPEGGGVEEEPLSQEEEAKFAHSVETFVQHEEAFAHNMEDFVQNVEEFVHSVEGLAQRGPLLSPATIARRATLSHLSSRSRKSRKNRWTAFDCILVVLLFVVMGWTALVAFRVSPPRAIESLRSSLKFLAPPSGWVPSFFEQAPVQQVPLSSPLEPPSAGVSAPRWSSSIEYSKALLLAEQQAKDGLRLSKPQIHPFQTESGALLITVDLAFTPQMHPKFSKLCVSIQPADASQQGIFLSDCIAPDLANALQQTSRDVAVKRELLSQGWTLSPLEFWAAQGQEDLHPLISRTSAMTAPTKVPPAFLLRRLPFGSYRVSIVTMDLKGSKQAASSVVQVDSLVERGWQQGAGIEQLLQSSANGRVIVNQPL
jgi:hypothetical protein